MTYNTAELLNKLLEVRHILLTVTFAAEPVNRDQRRARARVLDEITRSIEKMAAHGGATITIPYRETLRLRQKGGLVPAEDFA